MGTGDTMTRGPPQEKLQDFYQELEELRWRMPAKRRAH
jgi:hypothetical protein